METTTSSAGLAARHEYPARLPDRRRPPRPHLRLRFTRHLPLSLRCLHLCTTRPQAATSNLECSSLCRGRLMPETHPPDSSPIFRSVVLSGRLGDGDYLSCHRKKKSGCTLPRSPVARGFRRPQHIRIHSELDPLYPVCQYNFKSTECDCRPAEFRPVAFIDV